MSETYFKNFNIITYANNQAIDITERVVVLNNLEKNPFAYYPANITNGIRPDQFTNATYNDPYASWVLYLSNDIVDPYYEWYLNDHQFNEFIGSKYGSVEKAQRKVAYYINNWVDQEPLSVETYLSLAPNQQRYWEAIFDSYGRISSYSRRKEDWKSSTNFIVNLSISGTSNFVVDEVLSIKYTNTSAGKAQVAYCNSSMVVMKHCSGDFFPYGDEVTITDTSYVYGTESSSNCIITSCTFASNTIPSEEYNYWQEISYYDMEQEKNEGNKTIRVLQQQYVPQFIRNAKQLLGQ